MAIYVGRGLDPSLAKQVAEQLMTHDAIGAHARDELGISETLSARPIQAALASAASFATGAAMPLLVTGSSRRRVLIPLVSWYFTGVPRASGRVAARAGGARCDGGCDARHVLGCAGHGVDRWGRGAVWNSCVSESKQMAKRRKHLTGDATTPVLLERPRARPAMIKPRPEGPEPESACQPAAGCPCEMIAAPFVSRPERDGNRSAGRRPMPRAVRSRAPAGRAQQHDVGARDRKEARADVDWQSVFRSCGLVPVDAHHYSADVVLRDGGSIHVRAIRPDDRTRLLEHFTRLSPTSQYCRFHGVEEAAERRGARQVHRARLRAARRPGGDAPQRRRRADHRRRPLRRHRRRARSRTRAEVAFAVADAHQGRGIGTVVCSSTWPRSRARSGIEEFEADVLGENNQHAGGVRRQRLRRAALARRAASFTSPSRPRRPTAARGARRRARARRRRRERARDPGAPQRRSRWSARRARRASIGAALLANLIRRAAFTGPIYPCNPAAARDRGPAAYPPSRHRRSRSTWPSSPCRRQPSKRRSRTARAPGVRGVVVISAGFAERVRPAATGARAAARRRARLGHAHGRARTAWACSTPIPAVSLNATFAPTAGRPPGNVGDAVAERRARPRRSSTTSQQLNIGLSSFVSVGNKADVSGNDLLAYWARRSAHRRHRALPRELRQPAQVRAARARGGAAQADRRRQVRALGGGHARRLQPLGGAGQPRRRGRRALRAGGRDPHRTRWRSCSTSPRCSRRSRCRPGRGSASSPTPAARASCSPTPARRSGLALPELAPGDASTALRAFLPPQAGLANPVDMIASATPGALRAQRSRRSARTRRRRAWSSIYIPPLVTRARRDRRGDRRGAGAVPAEKPVLDGVHARRSGAPPRWPGARAAAARRTAFRRTPRWRSPRPSATAAGDAARAATVLELGRFAASAVRAVVDRVLDGRDRTALARRRATSRRCCAPPASPSPRRWRSRPRAPPRRPSGSATRWWPRRWRPASCTRATSAASSSGSSRRPRCRRGATPAGASRCGTAWCSSASCCSARFRRGRGAGRRHRGPDLRAAGRLRSGRRAGRAAARRRLPAAAGDRPGRGRR